MATTVSAFLPNAPVVYNFTLIPLAAYTPDDKVVVTSPFGVGSFSSAEITLSVTSPLGTISAYIQRRLADGVTYDSIARFTDVTINQPNSVRTIAFVHGGNLETSVSQSIAVGLLTTTMSGDWRIFVGMSVVGATFAVYGTFWQ